MYVCDECSDIVMRDSNSDSAWGEKEDVVGITNLWSTLQGLRFTGEIVTVVWPTTPVGDPLILFLCTKEVYSCDPLGKVFLYFV